VSHERSPKCSTGQGRGKGKHGRGGGNLPQYYVQPKRTYKRKNVKRAEKVLGRTLRNSWGVSGGLICSWGGGGVGEGKRCRRKKNQKKSFRPSGSEKDWWRQGVENV